MIGRGFFLTHRLQVEQEKGVKARKRKGGEAAANEGNNGEGGKAAKKPKGGTAAANKGKVR